ncbi:rRNA methylase [Phlyctema vagabunda]|uniref:rRNA methyltransferase 1, mitochondrial n=1 Tax=Phlyctema vagabunda TaxID=108571 RepID=A0ABR4PLV4_9HELO
MSHIAFSRASLNSRASSITLPLLYPSLYTIRAASINSAISKGLRRTKGVGFRGRDKPVGRRERPADEDARKGRHREFGRRGQDAESITDLREAREKFQSTRDNWQGDGKFSKKVAAKKLGIDLEALAKVKVRKGKKILEDPILGVTRKKSRAARFNDPNDSFGQRSSVFQAKLAKGELVSPNDKYDMNSSFDSPKPDKMLNAELRRENAERSNPDAFTQYYSTKVGKLSMQPRRFKNDFREPPQGEPEDGPYFTQTSTRPGRDTSDQSPQGQIAWRGRQTLAQAAAGLPLQETSQRKGEVDRDSRSSSNAAQNPDKKMPLSIPYTTSASEFLYGTSVVEAALTSKRIPRRKLYKLYIHTGENREAADRDIDMERLARKAGVEIVPIVTSWVRLMDKMSGGRPHNGYVLEASPLPRLPVKSLGEINENEEAPGYQVVVDYQSREEAEVNGTSNFVRVPRRRNGRNPFVLLLDEIVDPGNLGGIIRTASFLGVSAIAISTRNSASFTPVVLKASAGASENITLFSVNKPGGFVADSRLAGWKIYAAVAPSNNPEMKKISLSTDEIDNPLSEDPCLLMLGSEGHGLRPNLRVHADVELSIPGSGRSGSVDSLNVSVAAGILCNAFLRKPSASRKLEPVEFQPNTDPEKLF